MKCLNGTRCEHCGSTNMTREVIQSYSVKKGILGRLFFGVGGAAAGVNGKEEFIYNCGDCGHTSKKAMEYYEGVAIMDCISHPKTNASKKSELMKKYPNIDWSGKDVGLSIVENDTSSVSIANPTTNQIVTGNYNFEIKKGILKKYNGNEDNIIVPDGVTSIYDLAFMRSSIVTIDIPNGVTSIGEAAFQSCKKLKSIILPNTLTNIDVSAFAYCINLTTITIPKSVTYIGAEAFRDCRKLESVYFEDLEGWKLNAKKISTAEIEKFSEPKVAAELLTHGYYCDKYWNKK